MNLGHIRHSFKLLRKKSVKCNETQLKEFHARQDIAKDELRQGKAYMRKYFMFY